MIKAVFTISGRCAEVAQSGRHQPHVGVGLRGGGAGQVGQVVVGVGGGGGCGRGRVEGRRLVGGEVGELVAEGVVAGAEAHVLEQLVVLAALGGRGGGGQGGAGAGLQRRGGAGVAALEFAFLVWVRCGGVLLVGNVFRWAVGSLFG